MTESVITAPGAVPTNRSRAGDVVLRTRDLSKHYGKRLAVNNLNLPTLMNLRVVSLRYSVCEPEKLRCYGR